MTKLEIAKNINAIKDLGRIIATNWEMDFVEGGIYDNKGNVESWTDRDNSKVAFKPESTGTITYVLQCNKVPCHVVDYTSTDETRALGATGCEDEAECLVLPETKMIITYVSTEDDFNEMGYYLVEMEIVNE
ncbi:conserved hypothetical protein [Candidatus Desulfosporosinus infrequens]|uniref:Uncharacterized protein n=1 Tax=Candidatus Desulfosporosinus infrequens TaxID=2043169 RepID=A0A2U3LGT4_9FIRM|nr:conserved hypothetical protein [Candidatus Desulfosporosinus infrequens]